MEMRETVAEGTDYTSKKIHDIRWGGHSPKGKWTNQDKVRSLTLQAQVLGGP